VVGIEPSDDMRQQAQRYDPPPNVSFVAGWAHDTAEPNGSANVVVAAQALHWMDPRPTFAEVARILRPGEVFVALDCDWPPNVGNWHAEAAWDRCRAAVNYYEDRLSAGVDGEALREPPTGGAPPALPDHFGRDAQKDRVLPGGVQGWSKDAHLSRTRASGAFRWCTELAAQTVEQGDDARFVDLFRSQGHLRQLLAAGLDGRLLGVLDLSAVAAEVLGPEPRPFWFTYRVRLGVT
jgi:SAM-dependent methyltransferase